LKFSHRSYEPVVVMTVEETAVASAPARQQAVCVATLVVETAVAF